MHGNTQVLHTLIFPSQVLPFFKWECKLGGLQNFGHASLESLDLNCWLDSCRKYVNDLKCMAVRGPGCCTRSSGQVKRFRFPRGCASLEAFRFLVMHL